MSPPARVTPEPPTARQTLDKSMSEDELLQAIVEAALFMGWLCHHDRRSDKALQQGSAGFPDLCLIRRGRVLFLELKSAGGTLSESQLAWRLEMPPNSHAVTYLTVFPADLDAVLGLLR